MNPGLPAPLDPRHEIAAGGSGAGRLARPPVALYVHVPFCLSVCPYCDFVVYAARGWEGAARAGGTARRGAGAGRTGGGTARTGAGAGRTGPRGGSDAAHTGGAKPRTGAERLETYVRALLVELDLRADALDARFGRPGAPAAAGTRPALESVYLGGGTPSLLSPAAVERLLTRVSERFGLAPGAEVTLEANPGPRDRGDLAGFRAAGVTRLSLGAQSLEVAELHTLGRRHGPEDVREAVRLARRVGFEECSVDLLYDVPGQTAATWRRTLEGVLDLELDHVSAYALTLDDPEAEGLAGPDGDHLPVRRGARAWRERSLRAQDDDRAAEQYEIADELLGAAGLAWYEISNWARPEHASRHNLAYWRREPYEALGVGAHAFDGGRVRRWSAARIDGYLAALLPHDGTSPRLPPGAAEELTEDLVARERAILGLRLAAGLDRDLAQDPRVAPALDWARRAGLLEETAQGRARLTRRGRLLGNEVFARLL